jgi:hypothetical protein
VAMCIGMWYYCVCVYYYCVYALRRARVCDVCLLMCTSLAPIRNAANAAMHDTRVSAMCACATAAMCAR